MFRSVWSSSLRATSPLAHARTTPRSGLFIRTVVTKRFTKEHEWIALDSDTKIGTISITDYAQKQLGDVVFVELPPIGSTVEFGEPMGAVESVKAASDICAPMSGTVKELNPAVGEQPGLLNKSPENEGWLCKIEVSDVSEVEKLLSEEEYIEFCEQSSK